MPGKVPEKSLANLRPIPLNKRSKEEQKAIQALGGIASGKARRERKLMKERYAEFLLQTHKVKIGKKEITLTADEIINRAIAGNLMKTGTSASVAMIKELREGEGQDGGAAGTKKDVDLLAGLLGAPNVEQNNQENEG